VTFEKATAASLVQLPLPVAGPAPAPAPAAAPPPASSGSAPVGGGFDAAPPPDFAAPAVAAGPLVAAPTLPGPLTAVPVPQPQAAPAPAAAVPATLAIRRAAVPEDRSTTLLATALLVALGALAVRLSLQPATAPQYLGGAARRSRAEVVAVPVVDSPSRGVGRFRSARLRPPVRI
jgi:hypothetical protein